MYAYVCVYVCVPVVETGARVSPPPGAPSYALVIYINKKQKRYLCVTTIRRVTPHFALFPRRPRSYPGIRRRAGGITNTQGEARERERHSEHVHERYR